MEDIQIAETFPPGHYIREEIDARGWTQEDLATVMGRDSKTVNQLINGKRGVTADTAQQLAAAFGSSPELWMNLETAYKLFTERASTEDVARRAKLYETAPIKELIKRGWLPSTKSLAELEERTNALLDVPILGSNSLGVAARTSVFGEGDGFTGPQKAWIARCWHLAKGVMAAPYQEANFDSLIASLRTLMAEAEEVRNVPRVMASYGIRFVVVEHLPQTKIDGVAFWLHGEIPVVAMSLRYGRIDYFWHTLIHELVHIREKHSPVIDMEMENASRGAREDEVDKAAAQLILPSERINSFIVRVRPSYSKDRIVQFAKRNEIHPGIVVGQLQSRGEIEYRTNREMLVDVREIIKRTALTDGWGTYVKA